MTRREILTTTAAAVGGLIVAQMPRPATAEGAITIGRYSWEGPGSVNTWWIETDTSVIVIDVQRDLTHASEALAAIRAIGKPVTTILVTHGHPDHYAGIGLFKTAFPNLVAMSSAVTRDTIAKDAYGFNALLQQMAPDQFPNPVVAPDQTFADNATLTIDGVTIVTREMGKGDANSATAFYLPETGDLFAGDILLTEMHLFFIEQASTEWLSQIDRARILFPNALTAYPGHGAPGTPEALLAAQEDYIAAAREIAARIIAIDGADEAAQRKAIAEILARFPDHGFPVNLDTMMQMSIGGLFAELSMPDRTPIR
jgi:glyoxylase-like metal-dependent hydrolase (beta-lactamase superfamily II)